MARAPRRSFTASFVVTLAAVVPACTVSSAPPPQQPVTSQPQPVTNPPPEPAPVTVENPPRPQPSPTKPTGPTTTPMTPAEPGPTQTAATRDIVWTIMKSGTTCTAHVRVQCPNAEPGKPTPTCNPPPPMAYTCPAGWDGKTPLAVTQYQGSTECVIEATTNCAPNEKCKRPAPTKVPCPRY